MTKIALVTGACGFLGKALVTELIGRNLVVKASDIVDRPDWLDSSVEYIQCPHGGAYRLGSFLNDVSVVLHLAGLSDLDYASEHPIETVQSNIVLTVSLLDELIEFGVPKIIYASSIYGVAGSGGFYGCSKRACEDYLREFSKNSKLDSVSVRLGSLYGPGSNIENSVYRLVSSAYEEGVVRVRGAQQKTRRYLYVCDAARILADLVFEFPDEAILNLEGVEQLTFLKLGEILAEMLSLPCQFEEVEEPNHYRITPITYGSAIASLNMDKFVKIDEGLASLVHDVALKNKE